MPFQAKRAHKRADCFFRRKSVFPALGRPYPSNDRQLWRFEDHSPRDGPKSAPSSRRDAHRTETDGTDKRSIPAPCPTPLQLGLFVCALNAMLVHQRIQLFKEHIDVLELTVYRREANVGDLVDGIDMLHQQLADNPALDLGRSRVADFALHLGDDDFELADGYRTFLAGAEQAPEHLVPAELLAAPVLLDHHQRRFLDRLESRESTAALLALPPAANRFVIVGRPGIQHLRSVVIAERAFHVAALASFEYV